MFCFGNKFFKNLTIICFQTSRFPLKINKNLIRLPCPTIFFSLPYPYRLSYQCKQEIYHQVQVLPVSNVHSLLCELFYQLMLILCKIYSQTFLSTIQLSLVYLRLQPGSTPAVKNKRKKLVVSKMINFQNLNPHPHDDLTGSKYLCTSSSIS